MKILIDMNLSPDWTAVLEAENIEAAHFTSSRPRYFAEKHRANRDYNSAKI
ncbi:MAG: hypothetical protein ACR2HG_06355 [Pyrinomonadaceae bacterium]